MSRESLVFLFGVIVFLTPSLGIPEQWKFYVLSGSGLALVIIGYVLRRSAFLRSIDNGSGLRSTDSFVESSRKEPVPESEASSSENV